MNGPRPAAEAEGAHDGQRHRVQPLAGEHEAEDDHQLAVELLLGVDAEAVVADAEGQDHQAGAAEDAQPGPGQRAS